jgi:hypothetical protein
MVVRAALGAGMVRLRRLLMAENLLLTTMGAAFGIAIAVSGVGLLRSFAARYSPRAGEIALDSSVLGFTVVRRYEGYMILEHPMGIVINFGLDPDLVPSENMTNAYLRFTTSNEAVALYEEWVERVSDDGLIHAPVTTLYGMIEWGMTDPDANALRVGGPAEPN